MPTPLSLTFVGRQSELAQLADWLADPACRVITLVGPGGMGKTRLAQQAAAQAEANFAHGMAFVPLAALVSGDFLFPAIAEALGFSFYEREDQGGQLINYLRHKQLLLVLDSFEQTPAAASWVAALIQAAPQVIVLITSRQQPDLAGQRTLTVEGMGLPQTNAADDFDEAPAVRLFVQNARLLNPFYEIQPADRPHVRRICEMVGGLPLAIQMAAAWTRAISCEQIAAEIERDMDFLRAPFRSMPERHQSLKAIFDSSWRILPYAERVICRQLSVFGDRFDGEAAQQVAGASGEALTSLVKQSLLQHEPDGRYRLQTTVRQYAAARLAQDADEARQARQRHAHYFVDFVQARTGDLKSSQQRRALQEIAAIVGDVHLAWEFLAAERDFAALQRSAEGVFLFFTTRGRARQGQQIFEFVTRTAPHCPPEFLARCLAYQAAFALEMTEHGMARQCVQACLELDPPPQETAFAHYLLGRLDILSGDHAEAIQHLQHSLEQYTQINDAWGQARVWDALGAACWTLGDYASAGDYFGHALAAYRALDLQQGIASALDHLGVVAREQGDYALAQRYFEQSLPIFKELDARLSQAYTANHLGGIIAMQGDLPTAEPYLEECIALGREIGERRVVAYTLADWAGLLTEPGQSVRAQALFTEALTIFESLDEAFGIGLVWMGLGDLALRLGDLTLAEQHLRKALEIAVEADNPRMINEALHSLSGLLYQCGEWVHAARLLAFLTANESRNWLTAPLQQRLDQVRAHLPAAEFEQAVAQGQAQSLADILLELHVWRS
jgi:predicted ATPase/Flp pilus assembly protein TadD